MPSIVSRSDLRLKDSERALHLKNQATAIVKLSSVREKIADLKDRIDAASIKPEAMAAAIATGNFDIEPREDTSGLMAELRQLEKIEEALRLGIEKIEETIAARDKVLDEQYLSNVEELQRERFSGVLDQLLTLAELSKAECALVAEADELGARICKTEFSYWRHVGGRVGACASVGQYLKILLNHYGSQIGFKPSEKQRARLEALAD
ncbi:protein of unknown function [Georgfuchsia toluolica]|uniref:Uncharacterized protein n=1 Tax=Georgfuchsia toluolica TaxID=424218 RepID=A0A916J3A2_9PROT|nr:hypothetical protein [Georgfuchsia toluolica]CAG4883807.1 protein of unknown function [Georgfuchsia toluolica]